MRQLFNKTLWIGKRVARMQIPVYAAHASYFIILSVFPLLVLILSILRYTPLNIHSLISLLEGVLPAALLPKAEQLILNTYHSTSKTVIGLSAVTALWSASSGIYGLLIGLNSIYGVYENRSFWHTRLISVLYTFFFILMLMLTLVLHVFGNALLELLESSSLPLLQMLTGIIDLRFFLLLALQTALFTAMFMALPNGRNSLGNSLPGALLAAIGWTVFSQLFSLYIDYFPNYANIYGSMYAVVMSMLWLYFCILIVFYGGVLNRLLMKKPLD